MQDIRIKQKKKDKRKIDGTGGIEPPTLDSRGIEPRTTPMLREYYTTKPQARVDERMRSLWGRFHGGISLWMMANIHEPILAGRVITYWVFTK
ncbi:hypothetical protein F5Y12DRAFT_742704 [Xylaria sp. FL1777]|nr:hypothetical protein F5Y12DRAFT_742704 [Xylaria sp. FL1777]